MEMWQDIARTVDEAAQDEKMRQLEQYIFDRAYAVFIYSPLNLYAVNKEVNFVPQKSPKVLDMKPPREQLVLLEASSFGSRARRRQTHEYTGFQTETNCCLQCRCDRIQPFDGR
jgi:hypothetical protein